MLEPEIGSSVMTVSHARLPTVIWLVCCLTAIRGQEPSGRSPVPDAAAQAKAQELIHDVYGKELEATKTSEEKTDLAKKLLDQAAQSKGDPATHFVLLRIAKEVAVLAGDGQTAIEAVERTVQTYEVDAIEMKLECLRAVSKAAKSSSQRAALAEQAFSLVDGAVPENNFEAALEMGELARESALKAREFSLAKQIVARLKEVEKRKAGYGEYEKAMSRLRESPTDAEANFAAGRYLCLTRGDWDRGIPMLALGSDPGLKDLAVKELKESSSPEAQVALGDGWWDLAESGEGEEKTAFLVRAGYWYRQALPNVTSALVKAKLETQLQEIEKLGHPVPELPGGPPPAVAPFDEKQAKGFQSRWSRHLRAPVVLTNSIGMRLVLIPPGEFDMGFSQEEMDELVKQAKQGGIGRYHIDNLLSSRPQHRVKISRPFYLGMFEVTQAEYRQVTGTYPSRFQTSGPAAPVEQVSWNDTQEFCRRLSELPKEKAEGRVYRLPTEAEWEYACRAGTTTRYYFGDQDALAPGFAWFPGNSSSRTHPAGQKGPNAWGLYDMLGNVWEWCADWFGRDYYQQSPAEDPLGPSAGVFRVFRGGSWLRVPDYAECAYRTSRPTDYRRDANGFRVAITLAP